MGEAKPDAQAEPEKPQLEVRRSGWNNLWLFIIFIGGGALLVWSTNTEGFRNALPEDWRPWARLGWFGLLLPLIPVLVMLIRRKSLFVQIFPDRIVIHKGILAISENELFCRDIKSVSIEQGLFQRILGIGDVKVATSGTSGYELEAKGLPDPKGIRDLILKNKNAAVGGGEKK